MSTVKRAIFLPLLAAACGQTVEPGPAVKTLPVLRGTIACDGEFNDGPAFVCRSFQADRADAIFEYESALLQQGWKLTERSGRASIFPSGEHGSPHPLWFERPTSRECNELLSVHVSSLETVDGSSELGMFFLDGYEPECGAAKDVH